MTTPEIRESQIKGFLRYQKEKGGIVPSKLKDGNVILIETSQYVYEFKVYDVKSGRRFILSTGAPSCRGHAVCINIRSHSGKMKYEMADWIGHGMRLILKFTDGTSLLIGEVISAAIVSKEYKYELWGDGDAKVSS